MGSTLVCSPLCKNLHNQSNLGKKRIAFLKLLGYHPSVKSGQKSSRDRGKNHRGELLTGWFLLRVFSQFFIQLRTTCPEMHRNSGLG